MDPVVKRIERAVTEARERGGMHVGMPKVTLDCNDVVRLLTVAYRCPHIVTSDEGTSYCALGEARVRELEAECDSLSEEVSAAIKHCDRLEAENQRLREGIRSAPCLCYGSCELTHRDCWKRKALETTDGS